MKMILRQILVVAAMMLASPNVWAADRPSLDQVKALTLRAAELLIRDGVDKARETFHTEGEFKAGEIYVNVINANGTWLVYPPNRKNEGKSVLNVKDANGKLLVQDIIRVAAEKGEGWVEYHWLNPASNKIEPKASYVKNVPERGVITYIGVYR